jgi:hypothetical protein
MVSWLIRTLVEINGRIGLRVKYVGRRESRSALYAELRSIIQQAQESIVIVNTSSMSNTEESDDTETAKERKQYFNALLDRVRKGVSYHRVIQGSDETLLKTLPKERLRHFHEMLDEKARNSSLVGLTRAAETRPLTFTLVDHRWLMLEIDQRDNLGMHMEGILIFDDPQRTIVRDFDNFYKSITLSPMGSIERSDLPSLSG